MHVPGEENGHSIAIVGIACRLPGSATPQEFWRLLADSADALDEPPAGRFPTGSLSSPPAPRGGFLDSIDTFDADFFNISPREAGVLDPQQRLALELGWEALEDAGIVPRHLRGTRTSVFMGAMWDDYAHLAHARGEAALTRHSLTGTHRGMIANRLSYALGLQGPSLTVDTGQSSSLAAVHMACESLARGESDLALVGGVNLVLDPAGTTGVERFGALSPDGRCYTFDSRANGYARGEGGVVVVLKPTHRALADGDTVYCEILGSALNNDGATEGLTVPSARAQADVLRQAWERARVAPTDVQYVELHGTGTPAGDPVEAEGLGTALGTARPAEAPLLVGSVKTNIGHLEGAAGIAGLLKTVLSIKNRHLPASLNFTSPNPRIDLDALRLRVHTAYGPWPSPDRPLVAGVSSFGMGGTNCHVVLSELRNAGGDGAGKGPHIGTEDRLGATEAEKRPDPATGNGPDPAQDTHRYPPLILSARSDAALRAQAERLRRHLEHSPGQRLRDTAYSLATRRQVFERHAVVTGHDREDLLNGLRDLENGLPAPQVLLGRTPTPEPGGLAFLFSGQGSQQPGMGKRLHQVFPGFRDALDEVCAELDTHLGRLLGPEAGPPLRDVMFAERGTAHSALLSETHYTQAALFALETALFRLLVQWGLKPDHLAGHSVGEIAAAHAAGILDLSDAAELVATRGALMRSLPGGGVMLSVQAPESEVAPLLLGREAHVGLAAVNGPDAVVVSGERGHVAAIEQILRDRGRKCRYLRVSHAFHSPLMEPVLEEFAEAVAGLTFRAPTTPLVSNLTGAPVDDRTMATPAYWVRHVREAVRFGDGIRALGKLGTGSFLEVGPDGVLTAMARACVTAAPEPGHRGEQGADADAHTALLLPALRRGRDEARSLTEAVARLHLHGVPMDWTSVLGGDVSRVPLPTYAFQRESHWLPSGEAHPRPADDTESGTGRTEASPPRPHDVLHLVRSHAAAVLGHSRAERIDPDRAFRDLGFDSLTALELRDRLDTALGLRLPSSVLFDHPSPGALARFLQGDDTRRPEPGKTNGTRATEPGPDPDDEPIAIVGMACRFPGGVTSPEDLWRLLAAGEDAVSGFPTDRGWNVTDSATRRGGFLYDAGEFDAAFFGISPREALVMDPQQRLLLETSWEALERAGVSPGSLRGSDTAVYIGATAQDYGPRLHESDDDSGGYVLTGNTVSVASGRIAYSLGLEGPAVTVDTACSSSLVALHLAVQALRRGECSLALAGGATVMPSPGMFVEFSRQGGLSEDGRCKAFAATADGTGWAEGVGVLLVERLSDARRLGHRVLAVVRGSAVNQDGASNGLTAPNGPSQQRVIRAALADAGLAPADVDVVEAHGTGTRLGDPIEAQALLATYGQGRTSGRPVVLGSVKSNIGHTQAAAGVAGVMKMVLALGRGVVPRTLHVDEPSAHVDWSAGEVELAVEAVPWSRGGRVRRAGVSSFGISGTNAHVIVEEAPAEPEPEPERGPGSVVGVVPWVVSGRGAGALREQAARLAAHVSGVSAVDVGWSLVATRSVFEHRAVMVGSELDAMAESLAGFAAGGVVPGVVSGVAPAEGRRVVFVFPGQGSQWVGMAAGLLDACPVFAEAVAECAAVLDPLTGWSLVEVLQGRDATVLGRVDVVQPALWAVMVSLARTWRYYGVEPAAVVGHSQGEIAAACVAGGLSLADGARVVVLRSRAIARIAGGGGMVSVSLPAGRVRTMLEEFDGRVSVAAVNGPSSTVVSGDVQALDELLAGCEREGVRARRVPVDYASHSAQMDQLRDDLLEALATIVPTSANVPFFSTVTADWLDTTALDAGYWFTNLRETVRFQEAVEGLVAQGMGAFVECSPHPVLVPGITETLDTFDADAVALSSLRRDEGGLDRFLTSLAEAFVQGVPVDWSRAFEGASPRTVDLPTYPFQRQRYWLLDKAAQRERERLEDWRYHVEWRPVTTRPSARLSGVWAVAIPARLAHDSLVVGAIDALERGGARAVSVVVDERDHDRQALVEALRNGLGDDDLAGVLSLLALDEAPHGDHPDVPVGMAASLALVQAMADAAAEVPVWFATRGAVAALPGESPERPRQALLWGLGRVVALEQPQMWGGLVDLPQHLDEDAGRRLVDVVGGLADEDQLAVRASSVLARRLVRTPGHRMSSQAGGREWSPSGTVLVTGGTGALGAHVARWLAGKGAEHLVLISRRGADAAGAAALRDSLTDMGVRVTLAACDAADRHALETLLDLLRTDPAQLTAVIHAAGALDDGMTTVLTPEQMNNALRAKVTATVNLHELTRDLDLSAFVLFSSISATLGIPGQANYAPGNSFLDAFAEWRRAQGLVATSIAWGPWSGGTGMAHEGSVGERLQRHGVLAMEPAAAIAALDHTLASDETAVAVADIDWSRFFLAYTALRARPLIGEIPEARRMLESGSGPGDLEPDRAEPELAVRLAGLTAVEQERLLVQLVREQAAVVLGHSGAEAVAPDRAFKDLGFDSLTSVELRNRLNTATGLRLPVTAVFDYARPAALAGHLRSRLIDDDGDHGALPGVEKHAIDEPIAIVGMACRFPGGIASPEDLWDVLTAGEDVVSGLPQNRGWDLGRLYDPDPDQAGTSYMREGAFLHEAGEFDAAFFGISPREALAMDPQQRLLLETSWEALERAGITPSKLAGSPTGVFFGMSNQDYAAQAGDVPSELEGYLLTGSISSVASGRVAYTFGLEGPAVTVDTACSSSLVALHLAVQGLRRGECSLALVGGVTVMSSPVTLTTFSRQRGLSVDGRCKAFAASADGFGAAEGVGVLLVERLSDARRLGHRVLAVVRGSAVNQDGASNGLTAPNGPSQQRVIRAALADAGLAPADVDVVEAHGTGTRLGDPIEAQALLATYGQDRAGGRPVVLGSVKSNIGHTQAAAGVAGVMKMVLALGRGVVPKTLHVDEPSAHVDWSAGEVELAVEAVPWSRGGRVRRAGVSSFGISGTNAHVIVEEAPAEPEPERGPGSVVGVVPWVVSGRGAGALREQAARLAAHVSSTGAGVVDVGWSLVATRSVFEHRAVMVGSELDSMAGSLAGFAAGGVVPGVVSGVAPVEGRRVVFVFPGQGSQWVGMAAGLLDACPVFAEAVAECAAVLDPVTGWSLVEVLQGRDAAVLGRVDVVQPALWAVMVSLARAWRYYGVEPAAVVGHSQGEIAAACVAGGLSLADGARVVVLRSRAIARIAGGGGMVSVGVSAERVRTMLEEFDGRLSVAAVNGPSSTVVSGDVQALDELLAGCEREGVRARRVPVDYASHSAQMDQLRDELLEALADITPQDSSVPFFSTVTADWLDTTALDAGYWFTNLRETVRFQEAVEGLVAQGMGAFVECSPHPVLVPGITETLDTFDADAVALSSLRRDEGGLDRLLTSLAEAFVQGVPVDWTHAFEGGRPRFVDLPTYAFQRQHYWLHEEPLQEPVDEAWDAEFWSVVERGDATAVSDLLSTDAEALRMVLPALSSWRRRRVEHRRLQDWRYRVEWKPFP
ncbi:SDR family NAD(P)-dependent oxidoreductase, partial [Streptomyces eurythermus]|uniref:SDR family NAD(P)-dependent oxidoreductase n=1 Tax=Streptomyces eurythermus TaxID=42237 RepID=UPI0036FE2D77